MLCEVRQTVSGLRAEFAILEGGEAIGGALFPDNFLFGGPCACRYRGEELYLSYRRQPPPQNLGKAVEQRVWAPYTVARGGETVGEMCDKLARSGPFSRYGYTAMTLDGAQLEMFEMGLGRQGVAYPHLGRRAADRPDRKALCGARQPGRLHPVLPGGVGPAGGGAAVPVSGRPGLRPPGADRRGLGGKALSSDLQQGGEGKIRPRVPPPGGAAAGALTPGRKTAQNRRCAGLRP